MTALTKREIMTIVNQYIGVNGGYLGDFSYRTHADFYPEYCALDVDPNRYSGTTRERFISILENSTPDLQGRIVRGVLHRFPVGAENCPTTRTQSLYDELLRIVHRLEGGAVVPNPSLRTTSAVVARAIADAEALLRSNGATSGVDRIHTALHGYLRAVCDNANIAYDQNDSMVRLFRLIRQSHTSFQNLGPRPQDVERVLHSLSGIMDALNPIRNNASVAHPNDELLGRDEALLVINAARTIMHYFDSKIG